MAVLHIESYSANAHSSVEESAITPWIDRLVYQLYGLTEEELDFIIRSALPLASSKNYDIKYRMGDELSAEE